MLYLHQTNTRLALKLFRGEPAISGFDWNFSPIHTSSPPFSTDVRSGIDHPVSGLQILTIRPVKTCSRFGSVPEELNLASIRNSPDRSTKSTPLHNIVLRQFVNTGFQVLFHSPPGVLFTFPSQYYALSVTKVFSLTGWSPLVPSRFHVSRCTLDPAALIWISCTGLSPSLAGFPKTVLLSSSVTYAVRTPRCTHHGLGSARFARRYFGHRCFFLFLRLLRCFSSPGSPPYVMDWRTDT